MNRQNYESSDFHVGKNLMFILFRYKLGMFWKRYEYEWLITELQLAQTL